MSQGFLPCILFLSMHDMGHVQMKDLVRTDHSSQSDLQLLCAFARFQTDDDVADGFAVATHGILGLAGGQLSHLAFIHLLCFFDSQS